MKTRLYYFWFERYGNLTVASNLAESEAEARVRELLFTKQNTGEGVCILNPPKYGLDSHLIRTSEELDVPLEAYVKCGFTLDTIDISWDIHHPDFDVANVALLYAMCPGDAAKLLDKGCFPGFYGSW